MGIFDSWTEILEAALPWSTAEAEVPVKEKEEEGEEEVCCDLFEFMAVVGRVEGGSR